MTARNCVSRLGAHADQRVAEATLDQGRISGKAAGIKLPNPLSPTIFHEAWWLDIATSGRYDVSEVVHNGRVVGRMPHFPQTKLGYRVSLMPPLTHLIGPAIDEGAGTANTRFLNRLHITRDLIARLPATSYFRQKLHRGITDVLAFQMEDYDSSVQFTLEIRPRNAALIWNGMRDKTRNMVRKAQRTLSCETLSDVDLFIRMYENNIKARNKINTVELAVCRVVIAESLSRNCGQIYVARKPDATIAAAIFCVWDATSSYYLMSTRVLDSGNSAITLLLWQAIKDATNHGRIFDFDGVASAGAVLHYTGFGGDICPRYVVAKSSNLFRVLHDVRRLVVKSSSKFN